MARRWRRVAEVVSRFFACADARPRRPEPATCPPSPMLLALHKPYGVLSQFTPEPGSRWRTLADFGLPPAAYALGRLDADSEGLLLLSDEPGLNSRLLEPR